MNEQFQYFKKYAGFWKRFIAFIIDEIILGFVRAVLFIPLLLFSSFSLAPFFKDSVDENFVSISSPRLFDSFDMAASMVVIGAILVAIFISALTGWLYYALMESSEKQATFGKTVLLIKVTDLNGGRISFGKASARYFSKILSGLFFNIGYIMAAFTEKKQALHDIISGCLVINTSSEIFDKINSENNFTNM